MGTQVLVTLVTTGDCLTLEGFPLTCFGYGTASLLLQDIHCF